MFSVVLIVHSKAASRWSNSFPVIQLPLLTGRARAAERRRASGRTGKFSGTVRSRPSEVFAPSLGPDSQEPATRRRTPVSRRRPRSAWHSARRSPLYGPAAPESRRAGELSGLPPEGSPCRCTGDERSPAACRRRPGHPTPLQPAILAREARPWPPRPERRDRGSRRSAEALAPRLFCPSKHDSGRELNALGPPARGDAWHQARTAKEAGRPQPESTPPPRWKGAPTEPHKWLLLSRLPTPGSGGWLDETTPPPPPFGPDPIVGVPEHGSKTREPPDRR